MKVGRNKRSNHLSRVETLCGIEAALNSSKDVGEVKVHEMVDDKLQFDVFLPEKNIGFIFETRDHQTYDRDHQTLLKVLEQRVIDTLPSKPTVHYIDIHQLMHKSNEEKATIFSRMSGQPIEAEDLGSELERLMRERNYTGFQRTQKVKDDSAAVAEEDESPEDAAEAELSD